MFKLLIQRLFNSIGYEIKRKNYLGYELESEARQNILLIRKNTMLPYARLVSLYEQAVFCESQGIEGNFVECGTWKGGAVGLMALANLKYGSARRHLHLFDSFQGIPEPDESVDGKKAIKEARSVRAGTQGRLVPIADIYKPLGGFGTLEDNKELLEHRVGYDPNYLHYHKGWFQDTLAKESSEVGEIAILRLDGDWYASTKICLEYLYDKVVSGGFVIIDDYEYYEGCKKAVDEFRAERKINAYLNFIDSSGRYWIKS